MSAGYKTRIISEIRELVRVFRNAKIIMNLDQTMYKVYMIFIEKAKKKEEKKTELQSAEKDFKNKNIHFIENLKLLK